MQKNSKIGSIKKYLKITKEKYNTLKKNWRCKNKGNLKLLKQECKCLN